MYVEDYLLEDNAKIHAYDPKVKDRQMYEDLNYLGTRTEEENEHLLSSEEDSYKATKDAHAIAILTEWDEFKDYDC